MKYKITIKYYDDSKKVFLFQEKFAETNDVYHIIGFLQTTALVDVRSIFYEEISVIPPKKVYYKYDRFLDSHIHIKGR